MLVVVARRHASHREVGRLRPLGGQRDRDVERGLGDRPHDVPVVHTRHLRNELWRRSARKSSGEHHAIYTSVNERPGL
eukprot:6517792-Alexandrium_andersonii.AAC.1